jgi:predicted nucleic acid-binding Zn ribbon protein
MAAELVKIGSILWKSLDTLELKKDIFPKLVETNWKFILGPTLVQHCKFIKLEKEILYIRVNSADWFKELTELTPQLIKKVNAFFNKTLISEIEFNLPAYARSKSKPKSRTRTRTQKNRN